MITAYIFEIFVCKIFTLHQIDVRRMEILIKNMSTSLHDTMSDTFLEFSPN